MRAGSEIVQGKHCVACAADKPLPTLAKFVVIDDDPGRTARVAADERQSLLSVLVFICWSIERLEWDSVEQRGDFVFQAAVGDQAHIGAIRAQLFQQNEAAA